MKRSKEKVNKILQDLKENHNWSWAKEMYERNKKNLSKIALFYRGREITYQEMFKKGIDYSKAMASFGLRKNSEIPMCVSNCPEMVYMLLGASIIGAKVNIFGKDYNKDYIKQIINGSQSNILFATDDNFEEISEIAINSNVSTIVVSSLCESLPNNKDPYANLDENYYVFTNKVPLYKNKSIKIKDTTEFLKSGENYKGQTKTKVGLDDEFLITYSSGSTGGDRPKGIVHCNRSLIAMARFHDKDISTTPPMKNLRSLAHIPPFSNTDVITSISDSLAQNCSVALEPIYKKEFFPYSVLINEPSLLPATRSFWIYLMKTYDDDKNHFLNIINDMINNPNIKNYKYENYMHKKITLPFLGVPVEVGEPLSDNEEKYLNQHLRLFNAGTKVFAKPISPVCMSIGGGDCEHGGLFFNLMKSYKDKFNPRYLLSNTISGLTPYKMVDTMIIDEKGNKLGPNRIGRLVAKSPCTMKCYKNNEEETDKFFFHQNRENGTNNLWSDLNVYAYYDKLGDIHLKGRIGKEDGKLMEEYMPPFLLADTILKDTKNILSCEVIMQKDENNNDRYIANIELMPNTKIDEIALIINTERRLNNFFSTDITSNLVYRIRKNDNSFPLTGCGKRDPIALQNEDISDCIKPLLDRKLFVNAQEYFEKKSKKLVRVR